MMVKGHCFLTIQIANKADRVTFNGTVTKLSVQKHTALHYKHCTHNIAFNAILVAFCTYFDDL